MEMDQPQNASPSSPLDLLTSLLKMQQSSQQSATGQMEAVTALASAIERLASAIERHAAALYAKRSA